MAEIIHLQSIERALHLETGVVHLLDRSFQVDCWQRVLCGRVVPDDLTGWIAATVVSMDKHCQFCCKLAALRHASVEEEERLVVGNPGSRSEGLMGEGFDYQWCPAPADAQVETQGTHE